MSLCFYITVQMPSEWHAMRCMLGLQAPSSYEQQNAGSSESSGGQLWTRVLDWANQAAFASIFILIGGWILFRFVGPLTGLYALTNDLTSNSP